MSAEICKQEPDPCLQVALIFGTAFVLLLFYIHLHDFAYERPNRNLEQHQIFEHPVSYADRHHCVQGKHGQSLQ